MAETKKVAADPALAEAFAKFRERFIPLRDIIKREWEPRFAAFASAVRSEGRRIAYWEKHAPAMLGGDLRGVIIPFSQMSYDDLRELIEAHQRGGGAAVLQRVKEHYDAIFGNVGFLDALESSWVRDPCLTRRWPLLREALKAHRLMMYAVSIPVFISQFEGMIADFAAKPGSRFRVADVNAYIEVVTADEPTTGLMLSSFVADVFYAQFFHGGSIPPFSRHAILHGGDVSYATELNARTAILLIEELKGYLAAPDQAVDAGVMSEAVR